LTAQKQADHELTGAPTLSAHNTSLWRLWRKNRK